MHIAQVLNVLFDKKNSVSSRAPHLDKLASKPLGTLKSISFKNNTNLFILILDLVKAHFLPHFILIRFYKLLLCTYQCIFAF